MVYLFAKFDAMCFSKFEVTAEKIFDFRPLILDLECRNLIFVCETPSNYALSFDEVSLNLFE